MILYVFLTLILLILALLLWIIFTPVRVTVDTEARQYAIMQTGTLQMNLHPETGFKPEMKILGFNVPMEKKTKPVKKEKEQHQPATEKKKKKKKRSFASWMFLVRRGLKSIRLKKLILDIDTDDVVLNAQLFPVLLLSSRYPLNLSINFDGRLYMHLEMEARLNKFLWIFFLFLLKK